MAKTTIPDLHLGAHLESELTDEGTLVERYEEGSVFTFAPYGERFRAGEFDARSLESYMRRQGAQHGQIALTTQGIQTLLTDMRVDELRDFDPTTFAEIGRRGIEASIHEITIGNRTLVYKLFDPHHFERARQRASMMRICLNTPNYTHRLRFSELLVDFVNTIPLPMQHVHLYALPEYAASTGMHIMDKGPSLSVEDIRMHLKNDPSANDEAKRFVDENGITDNDMRALENEMRTIEELCWLALWCKTPPFKNNLTSDFSHGNCLVRGFNKETRSFDIVLIDQGMPLPWEEWPDTEQRAQREAETYRLHFENDAMRAWMHSMNIVEPTM